MVFTRDDEWQFESNVSFVGLLSCVLGGYQGDDLRDFRFRAEANIEQVAVLLRRLGRQWAKIQARFRVLRKVERELHTKLREQRNHRMSVSSQEAQEGSREQGSCSLLQVLLRLVLFQVQLGQVGFHRIHRHSQGHHSLKKCN